MSCVGTSFISITALLGASAISQTVCRWRQGPVHRIVWRMSRCGKPQIAPNSAAKVGRIFKLCKYIAVHLRRSGTFRVWQKADGRPISPNLHEEIAVLWRAVRDRVPSCRDGIPFGGDGISFGVDAMSCRRDHNECCRGVCRIVLVGASCGAVGRVFRKSYISHRICPLPRQAKARGKVRRVLSRSWASTVSRGRS